MASLPNLTVRLANPSDYEAVRNIDKHLYYGQDYMPSWFHKYLADPLRIIRVVVLDGSVVGLVMDYFVDEGQTLIKQAGRLSPSVRGRGIWKILKPELRKLREIENNNYVHEAFTTANWRITQQRIRSGETNDSLIMIRTVACTEVEQEQLEWPVTVTDKCKPSLLSKASAFTALTDVDNLWQLFPHGRIVCGVCWEAFRLQISNFEIIINNASAIYGTRALTVGESTHNYSSLSFGFCCQVKEGLIYRVDYYGSDEEDAASHYVAHMRIGQKLYTTRRQIGHLTLSLRINKALVKDYLQRVKGLKPLPDYFPCFLGEARRPSAHL